MARVTKITVTVGMKVPTAPYTILEISETREVEMEETDVVAVVERQQYDAIKAHLSERLAPIAAAKAKSLHLQLENVDMTKAQRERIVSDLSSVQMLAALHADDEVKENA